MQIPGFIRALFTKPLTQSLPGGIETAYEPFSSIIRAELSGRRERGGMALNPVHRVPEYVIRMSQQIVGALRDVGCNAELADVLRVERTARGHCDYERKFALRCNELKNSLRV